MKTNKAKRVATMHTLVKDINRSMDLEKLTMAQLVELYNKHTISGKTVKKFSDKKTAIARVKIVLFGAKKEEQVEKKVEEKVEGKPTKTAKITKVTKTTKATKPAKTEKVEAPKATRRYAFGKKVSHEDVAAMVTETFGGKLKAINVQFVDNHYWYGDITMEGVEEQAKMVRIDYLVNHLRIPRAFGEHRQELLAAIKI